MADKYVSWNGSDAANGDTPGTAWKSMDKLSAAVAVAANGITRAIIDSTGGPVRWSVSTSCVFGVNAANLEVLPVSTLPRADIRASKVLSGTYTQYDATNFPLVWMIASGEVDGVLWDADKWMYHIMGTAITGAGTWRNPVGKAITNYTTVADGLTAKPGSYFNDGTNVYFTTADGSNPNTNGRAYELARSFGGTGSPAIVVTGGGVNIHDVHISHTAMSRKTDGDPLTAYCIMYQPSANGTSLTLRRVACDRWSKHAIGVNSGDSNHIFLAEDCTGDQGTPYTVLGGNTVWVSFNSNNTAVGNSDTWRRCGTTVNEGLWNSLNGTIDFDDGVFITHNNGGTGQYTVLLLEDCDMSNGGYSSEVAVMTVASGLTLRGGRYSGFNFLSTTPLIESTRFTLKVPTFAAGGTLRDSVIVFTENYNTKAQNTIAGTVVIEGNTFDARTSPSNFGQFALWLRNGALTITVRDNVFWLKQTNNNPMAVVKSMVNTDTITWDYNRYLIHTNLVVVQNYNDGTTTSDRTLAQWQGLGKDTNSSSVADLQLNAEYRPIATSPVLTGGVNRGAGRDKSRRAFAARQAIGAYEYYRPGRGKMLMEV